MIFREIHYPEDPFTRAAARLTIAEVFHEIEARPDEIERFSTLSYDSIDFCLEDESLLLAVGSLGTEFFEQHVAYLERIAVMPALHGEGIGTELVQRLEERARELGNSLMRVTSLSTAVPFYERNGYHPIDEIFTLEMAKLL